jgi:hypothetical protein
MARYSALLGLQVEVQYRAGDILLPASGTFVGDTGRSVFLEQNFEQRGQRRHFRWEIPYQYIVRLAEKTESVTPSTQDSATPNESSPAEILQASGSHEETENMEGENATTTAAAVGANVSMIFPRPQQSNI